MMLYTIFVVCVIGSKNYERLYAEMPRPPGVSATALSDAEMQKMCIHHNKEDHSFDMPVFNPQGLKVKITPTDCILSDGPPSGIKPANAFVGYHE